MKCVYEPVNWKSMKSCCFCQRNWKCSGRFGIIRQVINIQRKSASISWFRMGASCGGCLKSFTSTKSLFWSGASQWKENSHGCVLTSVLALALMRIEFSREQQLSVSSIIVQFCFSRVTLFDLFGKKEKEWSWNYICEIEKWFP